MTAPLRRSIPTLYAGTQFRSKLEADYARTFDILGVEWEYEQLGQYFGDVFYFPDFFLPKSRQYVEVKGVFEPNDCRKIQALLANVDARRFTDRETCPDISIVACEPNGVFRGWERNGKARDESFYTFLTKRARVVELFACARCRGWWFGDATLSWQCQCCGAYDGNGHLASQIASPFPDFPDIYALSFLAIAP